MFESKKIAQLRTPILERLAKRMTVENKQCQWFVKKRIFSRRRYQAMLLVSGITYNTDEQWFSTLVEALEATTNLYFRCKVMKENDEIRQRILYAVDTCQVPEDAIDFSLLDSTLTDSFSDAQLELFIAYGELQNVKNKGNSRRSRRQSRRIVSHHQAKIIK